MNIGETVNEISIVLSAYNLFWFTDYVPDPESELFFGWGIIGILCGNLTFNVVIFVISLILYIKRLCLRCFA